MRSHVPVLSSRWCRFCLIVLLIASSISGMVIVGATGEEGYVQGWLGMPEWVLERMDTASLPDRYYPENLTAYQNEDPAVSSFIASGNSLLAAGSFSEAKNAFEEAINRYPDSFDAWLGRGQALEGLNRTLSAEDSFDRAVSLSGGKPNAWAAYAGKGRVLSAQERYQEADGAFSSAISLFETGIGSPEDLIRIYTWLAEAEEMQGNSVKAAEALRSAEELRDRNAVPSI